MAKYKSKPKIIEAEQWFPGKQVNGVAEYIAEYDDGPVIHGECITIHGQVTIVVPGDFIITEPDGIHHYPCKPDIFHNNYEPI